MREINFRVWDNVDKKFISLDDYQKLGAVEIENDGTLTLSPRYRFLTSLAIMPERFIPCEFTGLKDENGKKIFEGDIVSYTIGKPNGDSVDIEKEVVKFDYMQLVQLEHSSYLKVIGNIYENQEV